MSNDEILLSRHIDDWLDDRYLHETRWEVRLSNGEYIYQDDYRPGVYPESSWLRLKKYCDINNLHIADMRLQFRSNIKHVKSNMDGYLFLKGAFGGVGGKSSESRLTGVVENGILTVVKWKVPEMIQSPFIDDSMEQIRNIEDYEDIIIRKK